MTDQTNPTPSNDPRQQNLAAFIGAIALGGGTAFAFGAALKNWGMGITLGAGMSVTFSVVLRNVFAKSGSKEQVLPLNVHGRARTCNLRLRRPTLYPIELRGLRTHPDTRSS